MPKPPNSCLVITIATKAPTTPIHKGRLTGKLSARIRPVTTADRSPTGLGFFIKRVYRYSNSTQAAVVTISSTRARIPKIIAEASTQGIKASTTVPIILRVVAAAVICGEAVTIKRSSIFIYLPEI